MIIMMMMMMMTMMTIKMQTQALAQVSASLGENNGCKDNAPRETCSQNSTHDMFSGVENPASRVSILHSASSHTFAQLLQPELAFDLPILPTILMIFCF